MVTKTKSAFEVLSVLVLLSACGGNPVTQVCDAAADQLFKTCDTNKEQDVQAIWNAVQGMGGAISSQEITSSSKGEVAEECKKSMTQGKVQLTDEEAKKFKESIANTTSCQATVDMIRINVGQML